MAERGGPILTLIPVDQGTLNRLAQGEPIEPGIAYGFPTASRRAEEFFDGPSFTVAELITPVNFGRPGDKLAIQAAGQRIAALRTILGPNARFLDMSPWDLAHPANPKQATEGYTAFANEDMGIFILNVDTADGNGRFTVETEPTVQEALEIRLSLAGKQEESSQPTGISQSEA